MIKYGSARKVMRECATLLRPPKRQPLSQAAREVLYVKSGNAMERWDGDLVPYMHEPMDCLSARAYDAVIFVGPARTSKTVSLVDGWVCNTIVNDPADMLVVQITEEKAREFSKKRLSRAFDSCPPIKAAMSPRASDNNVHDKVFKAGNFLKIGWPSKNILASSDWKRVALTDYDRMPTDVDGEGSPFILAAKRTQTFMSSGMVLVESSPKGVVTNPNFRPSHPHEALPADGIISLYNQGDRRCFYWQCPDCQDWFEPDFDLLVYEYDEPDPNKASESVFLRCPICSAVIEEQLKSQLNQSGQWLRQGETIDKQGVRGGEPRQSRYASFWQKSPTAAFQTWSQLVYKYVAAKRKFEETGIEEDLKTTINVDQGKPYIRPHTSGYDAQALQDRQANYGKRVVPDWVRFLTAAIDIQAGKNARFVVQVIGWGEQLEHLVVDRFSLTLSNREDDNGKRLRVSPGSYNEDWDILIEQVILRTYQLADDSNRVMPIIKVACDSGGEAGVTDNAYQFYRRLKKAGYARRFMLIKGASRHTAPTINKTYPDNSKRSNRKAIAMGDVPVYLLNTHQIKDTVSNCLDREVPGPRYVHFPRWLDSWFFDELTSERRLPNGCWERQGSAPNEAWDLMVYNWACIYERKADLINWDNPPGYARPWDDNSEIQQKSDERVMPKRRRRRRTF